MIDYYGRDVNPIQENYDFSKEFMKNIIQEQDKLLGPRGKEYEDQIHAKFYQRSKIKYKGSISMMLLKKC